MVAADDAIVFSVAMLVPVWRGSANFLLTIRGQQDWIHRSPAMFILVGVLGYLLGSMQGTVEAIRAPCSDSGTSRISQSATRISTMYGFVTFAIWGGIYALLPGHRQAAVQPRGGHPFLAGDGGGRIYVWHFPSAAPSGPRLDPRRLLHPIGGGHGALYWLWRSVGGALDVPRPSRVRLERLDDDLRPVIRRGAGRPTEAGA